MVNYIRWKRVTRELHNTSTLYQTFKPNFFSSKSYGQHAIMNNNIKAYLGVVEKIKKMLVIEYTTTSLYQQHNKHIKHMKKTWYVLPKTTIKN